MCKDMDIQIAICFGIFVKENGKKLNFRSVFDFNLCV